MSDAPIKPDIGFLDKFYSEFVLKTVPFWHNLKFNPNMMTTLGLIFSILFVYFLWKKNLVGALICLFTRQYFDYADGIIARKYDQVTKFGDYYDHISDTFFFIVPFLVVLIVHTKRRLLYLSIVIPAILLAVMQLGCLEKEYKKEHGKDKSPTLAFTEKLCFNPKILRFFDTSFMYIIIAIVTIMVCLGK